MDSTVRLGPLKFSLRATIDHHGPCIHSGHYTASINCCEKHSIATITQLRSLELLTAKTPRLHMLYDTNWHMIFGLIHWHIHALDGPDGLFHTCIPCTVISIWVTGGVYFYVSEYCMSEVKQTLLCCYHVRWYPLLCKSNNTTHVRHCANECLSSIRTCLERMNLGYHWIN